MIYLDNASTTRLSTNMIEYLTSILPIFGNPSSLHSEGVKARQIIEQARKSIQHFINAPNESDILFTSSGSASNTLFINSFDSHDYVLLYSPIVHKSMLNAVKVLSYAHKRALKVDGNGFIDLEDLEHAMHEYISKPIVVIDYANSEIGTIQNVEKIIQITHKHGGIVYLDCTGSIPSISLDVKKINVDAVGFSGHKLGALKGVGVFYKKKDLQIKPLIHGSQEQGVYAGTENLLGIASLGKSLESYDYNSISSESRDYVYNFINKRIESSYLVGASIESGNRLKNNLYVCFPNVTGETLLIMLDMNGILVSTGSACSSGELAPSPTLVSIGMKSKDIHSCIRLSFSGKETQEELKYVCDQIYKCILIIRNGEK